MGKKITDRVVEKGKKKMSAGAARDFVEKFNDL